MYRILLIFCSFHFTTDAFSQITKLKYKSAFEDNFSLGANLTYIVNSVDIRDFYHELTLNLNGAIDLFQDYYRFGPEFKIIWTKETYGGRQDVFYMAGIYNQFNFLSKRKSRIFIETSLQLSDMCICDRIIGTSVVHIKRPGTIYLGLGAGGSIYLSKRIDLDLGFTTYNILEKILYKSAYTQYVIGMRYYFGKRNKGKKKANENN